MGRDLSGDRACRGNEGDVLGARAYQRCEKSSAFFARGFRGDVIQAALAPSLDGVAQRGHRGVAADTHGRRVEIDPSVEPAEPVTNRDAPQNGA